MSINTYTYIGPYVRCRSRTTTAMQSIQVCINPLCTRYEFELSSPHCPMCGGRRERHTREVKADVVDRWRMNAVIDEALTMPVGVMHEVEAPNVSLHSQIA